MTTAPLAGKRALVTGGSRGIGAEIVRRLAADGAAVAFTYGTSTADAEKVVADVTQSGGTALAIQADAADPTQTTAAIERTVTELGGVEVLVNNAGVLHAAPIDEFPAAEFDRQVAVNISGMFWAVHAAVKHMDEGSRIINIGSCLADRVQAPGMSVYAMTRGAVSAFTRGLARELGPRGITVNNVAPGPIATDMTPTEGEFAESLKQAMAVNDYGHTTDIAAVVSLLASPESGYITGADWNVDGGFTA
jgi:3-oxoacyl-[acyl-carrier protein] reductase